MIGKQHFNSRRLFSQQYFNRFRDLDDRVLCEIQGTWYDSVVKGIFEVEGGKVYQIFVNGMNKWQ